MKYTYPRTRLLPLAALAQSPRLIFHTDMGSDIDDALALATIHATIHALESRGEVKLIAVNVT